MAPKRRKGRNEGWSETLANPPLPPGVEERALVSEPFSFVRAVQQVALASVLVPDEAAYYRRIFRWYSKTFATPLHVAETLPTYDVLLAYYEDRYEQMDEKELEVVRQVLAETDQERKAREEAKDAAEQSDDEYLADLERQEAARIAAEQAKAEVQQPRLPELPSISQDFSMLGKGLTD